jgi:hypothetical protein
MNEYMCRCLEDLYLSPALAAMELRIMTLGCRNFQPERYVEMSLPFLLGTPRNSFSSNTTSVIVNARLAVP